jgi:hypothetical protein
MGKVDKAEREQIDEDHEEEGPPTEEIPLEERIPESIESRPPFKCKDWGKYVYEGRVLGIVDRPGGRPQAWYIRTGKGGESGPGEPAQGDPAPFYGVAIVEKIDKDTKSPIPDEEPSPWMIKPSGGRLGPPGTFEYFGHKDVSDWLKSQTPAHSGQDVTEIKIVNDWLREHSIELGGGYKVGDEVTLGERTDLTTMPNTVDYYEKDGIIYKNKYCRIKAIP